MGRICADLFVTLDGVYQAPGGPEEDSENRFEYGGWQGTFVDEESGAAIYAGIQSMDALLLGRKTYDIFAGYWPLQSDDNPIAAILNGLPKFAVSNTLTTPTWEGAEVLSDLQQVAALKDRFAEIHTIGSGALVGSMLEAGLLDRLNLVVYPVTLGKGKRLFGEGTAVSASFRVAEAPRAFAGGAVWLTYDYAGVPVTGIDMDDL